MEEADLEPCTASTPAAVWLDGREPGATITVTKLAELAFAWWDDRLAPDWLPHPCEQNMAILERLGPGGEFWALP